MKSKTFYFAVLLVSFLTLISTASAACSSCGSANPSTGEDCPTCGDAAVDESECTVAITEFNAVADCSTTPCTVSFSGSVDGDAAKIKYYLINENGKKVCSKLATCENGVCEATCKVFKAGTYTAVMKACGSDGQCVTQTTEVAIGNSEDADSEVSDGSCGSCDSDNGRYDRWNRFELPRLEGHGFLFHTLNQRS